MPANRRIVAFHAAAVLLGGLAFLGCARQPAQEAAEKRTTGPAAAGTSPAPRLAGVDWLTPESLLLAERIANKTVLSELPVLGDKAKRRILTTEGFRWPLVVRVDRLRSKVILSPLVFGGYADHAVMCTLATGATRKFDLQGTDLASEWLQLHNQEAILLAKFPSTSWSGIVLVSADAQERRFWQASGLEYWFGGQLTVDQDYEPWRIAYPSSRQLRPPSDKMEYGIDVGLFDSRRYRFLKRIVLPRAQYYAGLAWQSGLLITVQHDDAGNERALRVDPVSGKTNLLWSGIAVNQLLRIHLRVSPDQRRLLLIEYGDSRESPDVKYKIISLGKPLSSARSPVPRKK